MESQDLTENALLARTDQFSLLNEEVIVKKENDTEEDIGLEAEVAVAAEVEV